MSPHKVVSFDPGNHTGIAYKDISNDNTVTYDTHMIFEDLPRVYQYIINKPELVVIEQFYTPGSIDRHGIYTIRLIGGIIALCWHLKIPIVEHLPQMRYPYIEKARAFLKAQKQPYTQHHIDALAHLFTYEEQGSNLRTKVKDRDTSFADDIRKRLNNDS